MLQDLFFLGFPDFVNVTFVDCLRLAAVGIAVVAGIFEDDGMCFMGDEFS